MANPFINPPRSLSPPLTQIPIITGRELELGGISLDVVAQLLADDRVFTGAGYDRGTGQVVLFSESGTVDLPPIDKDDLAVAIRSVFELGETPGVSIGTDGTDAEGNFLVRYDGGTVSTKFGQVMFEADLVLKMLTLGTDNDPSDVFSFTPPAIPGYQSMMARYLAGQHEVSGTGSNRIWFVPKEVILTPNEDGTAFVFDSVAIDVLTESKMEGEVISNPFHEDFANHIRDNWEEYAEVYPQLKQIERLARIVGVVKWLKDSGMPLDLGYLGNYTPEEVSTEVAVKPKLLEDSWSKTTTKVVTRNGRKVQKKTTHVHTITIQGGVSYSTPNELNQADSPGTILRAQALEARSNQPDGDEALEWEFGSGMTAHSFSLCREAMAGALRFGQTDMDFPVKGDFSLGFRRSYSSFQDEDEENLGEGWDHSETSLRFPSAKQLFTYERDDHSQFTAEWYPEIIVLDNASRKRTRYFILSVNENDEPLYRADVADALFVSQNYLVQTSDDAFRLSNRDSQSAYVWNPEGKLTKKIDANGNEVNYTYQAGPDLIEGTADDQLISITSGEGNGFRQINLIYGGGSDGNHLSRVEGPYGIGNGDNVWADFSYDSNDRLTTVTHSLKPQVTFFYDNQNGKMVSAFKNQNGGNAQLFEATEYDLYKRPKFVNWFPESGNSLEVEHSFDVTQGMDANTTSVGSSGSKVIDDHHRVTEVTDAEGRSVILDYEGDFGPSKIENRRGYETELTYDGSGNLVSVTDPLLRSVHKIYYPNSNLVFVSYVALSDGSTSDMTAYDYEDGKIKRVYEGASNLTLDESTGQFEVSVDPNGVTEFHYENGELVGVTSPENETTSFLRQNNDVGVVDKIVSPTGLTMSIEEFDPLLRPKRVRTWSGEVLNYGYTGGAVTSLSIGATNPEVLWSTESEGNGTLMSVAKDGVSNILRRFQYTEKDELSSVVDGVGSLSDYEYAPDGGLSSAMLPGGSRRAYSYDDGRRVQSLSYLPGNGTGNVSGGPMMVVSPTELDFGVIDVGEPKTKTLKIFNMGESDLVVSDLQLSSEERLQVNLAAPLTIAPNGVSEVLVTATVELSGALSERLVVEGNDPHATQVVVQAFGTGDDVGVSPPEAVTGLKATPGNAQVTLSWDPFTNLQGDFASFQIYRSAQPITSEGIGSLSPIGLVGDVEAIGYTDYGLTNGVAYYYAVAAKDLGGNQGPEDSVGPVMPYLGNAVASFSSGALNFGNLPVGTTTSGAGNLTFDITNEGGRPLRILYWYVDHPVFTVLNPPEEEFEIAPGDTYTFTVQFAADFPGELVGKLVVVTNDAEDSGERIEKELRGVGTTTGVVRTVSQSGGADFSTIQAAINASGTGDTIQILDSATYVEDVNVGLSPAISAPYLTLAAAGGQSPVIQGSPTGQFALLILEQTGFRLEGVSLQGGERGVWVHGDAVTPRSASSLLVDCELTGSDVGAFVNNAGSLVLQNSEASQNNAYGAFAYGTYSEFWAVGNAVSGNGLIGCLIANKAQAQLYENDCVQNGAGIICQRLDDSSSHVGSAGLRAVCNQISYSNDPDYPDGIVIVNCDEAMDDVALIGNELMDVPRCGLYLTGSKATVRYNSLLDTNWGGLSYYGLYVSASEAEIQSNTIDRHILGIWFNGESEGVVSDNLFSNQGNHNFLTALGNVSITTPGSRGILVENTAQDVQVVNNSVIGTADVGLEVTSASSTTVANNIVAYNVSNSGSDITGATLAQVHSNYLELDDPQFVGQNGNISGDLALVNVGRGDFRLRPSSVAIDAGSDARMVSGSDLYGEERKLNSAVDIGAMEMVPAPDIGDIELSSEFFNLGGSVTSEFMDFRMDMGTARVGEFEDRIVTVSNVGGEDLVLYAFEVLDSSGLATTDFMAVESFPITIAGNSSIDVTIRFSPEEQKGYTGYRLLVKSDSYYNGELIGSLSAAGVDPPAAVTGLTAISGETNITLSWNSYDVPADFTRYRIYRSNTAFTSILDEGVFEVSGSPLTNGGSTSFVDDTVTTGQTYYYAVIPEDDASDLELRARIGEGEFQILGPVVTNAVPVPSNITSVFDPQSGWVTVSYDLADSENGEMEVGLEYWDGVGWQTANSVTGDIGILESGTGLIAVWNARADTSLDVQSQIRLIVKDVADPASVGQSTDPTVFALDTLAPIPPEIQSGILSPTKEASQEVYGVREDDTALYVNGVLVVPADSDPDSSPDAWTYEVPLMAGENVFAFSSVDDSGNESDAVNVVIVLDDSPPGAPVVSPVSSPTMSDTITLTGSKPIDTALVVARWDSGMGDWFPFEQVAPDPASGLSIDKNTQWALEISGLAEGTNRLQFRTQNAAGVLNLNPVVVEVVLDVTAPIPPVVDPLEEPYSSPGSRSLIELTGTKSPDTSLWINGEQVVARSAETTWSLGRVLFEGQNDLAFTVRDEAGNESLPTNVSYVLDTTVEDVTNLTATEVDHHVEVDWTPIVNTEDFAAYILYRSDEPITSTEDLLAFEVLENAETDQFVDVNVEPGETYYYGIATIDALGNRSLDPVPVAAVTLAEGQRTMMSWVVGNEEVPAGASYDFYVSASPMVLPESGAGVEVYEGSFVATGREYFWRVEFLPAVTAPSADTVWSAFLHDSASDDSPLSPIQELAVNGTPQATATRVAVHRESSGDDRLEASVSSSAEVTIAVEKKLDGEPDWSPLYSNDEQSKLSANYLEPNQISEDGIYRIRISVD